jgi:hypothetical protein
MKMQDLEIAKRKLNEGGLTLSIAKQGRIIYETGYHGISGFLNAIEKLHGELEGASVADKVAGKAVAFLCIYSKIRAVYASTLSRRARAMFEENEVHTEWEELVENILDKDRTMICPFEDAARDVRSPPDAYRRFKALQESLKQCR